MKVDTLAGKANGMEELNFDRYYGVSPTAFGNWVMLRHTQDAMWKVTNRVVGQWGLSTSQYITLSMLCSAKCPMKQGDLARGLFQEQNTISGRVDRMERMGLVRRERSLKDRRQVILHPTDMGRDVARRAHEVVSDIFVDLLSSINTEEHDRFREILLKLRSTALGHLGISPEEMDSLVLGHREGRLSSSCSAASGLNRRASRCAPLSGAAGGSRSEGGGASRWARIIRRGVRSIRARR